MRLPAVILMAIVAGCASGPSPLEQEWQSYTRYLHSEVQAGRMTQEHAQYLATAKRNELLVRQRAEQESRANAAAAGLGMMQSSGPYQNSPSITCNSAGSVTTCR